MSNSGANNVTGDFGYDIDKYWEDRGKDIVIYRGEKRTVKSLIEADEYGDYIEANDEDAKWDEEIAHRVKTGLMSVFEGEAK